MTQYRLVKNKGSIIGALRKVVFFTLKEEINVLYTLETWNCCSSLAVSRGIKLTGRQNQKKSVRN